MTTIPATVSATNSPDDKERRNYVSAGAVFLVIGFLIFASASRALYKISKQHQGPNFAFWVGFIFMIIGVALLSKKA